MKPKKKRKNKYYYAEEYNGKILKHRLITPEEIKELKKIRKYNFKGAK